MDKVVGLREFVELPVVDNWTERSNDLKRLDGKLAKKELVGVKGVDEYLKGLIAFNEAGARVYPKTSEGDLMRVREYQTTLKGPMAGKEDFCQSRINALEKDIAHLNERGQREEDLMALQSAREKRAQIEGWKHLLETTQTQPPISLFMSRFKWMRIPMLWNMLEKKAS